MFSHRTRRVSAGAALLAALVVFTPTFSTSALAQGIVEKASANAMRPKFSGHDVPSSRGRFTFPSPYNTEAVRLTEAGDCSGSDCVRPVGYAYWSNINNHVGSDTMLIFLSLKDHGGPTLFSYNKNTGETRKRGALFEGDSTFGWARLSTGEGWYFSGTRPNALYINEPTGTRLFRYDVLARSWETVFDMSGQFPNKYLWQVHSSNDDRVHSFTVRDKGSYAMEGCAIYREDQRRFIYYARKGNDFDECQIDKSGRWLVIKEQLDGANGEDNRIIDIDNDTERVLHDPDGAAGHSDVGYGYLVAEDNFNNQPGAVRVWDFSKELRGGQPVSSVAGQGTLVYQLSDWMSLAQHIAHGNSKPGISLNQQIACASNGSAATAPRINEIVCFKLDGSLDTLIVAPTLTDVNASGSGGTDGDAYWKYPKGNLDITGEYFIWTTNGGTNRLDAFVVKVPLDRLGASASGSPAPSTSTSENTLPPSSSPEPAPAPAPAPAPEPAPAPTPSNTSGGASPVSWTSVVNATTIGSSLVKAGGCGGCADAGAVSAQAISSGDGYVEFTVPESGTLRFIGLSSGNSGTDPGEIKFALRLQGGNVEVRESGAYRSETRFAANDTLRVAYVGGTVQYSKNGSVFYSSAARPVYPAIVDATLFDENATLWNVMIGNGGGSSSTSSGGTAPSSTESAAPAPSAGPVPVAWTSQTNTSANGNTLTKTGGCSGCPDAGAVSAQQITSSGGYVELSGAGSGLRFIGLSSVSNGTDPGEITFSLRLQGGAAEVRESGAYRSEAGFSAGDTLRIALVNGTVEYSKNGSVFYRSSTGPSYPLIVDTSLFDANASLSNVMVASAGGSSSLTSTSTAAVPSVPRQIGPTSGSTPTGRTAIRR